MASLNDLASTSSAAVRALQKWYGADSYAASTGLYHWDDPDLAADVGGAVIANLIIAAGYRDATQDTLRWWNSANAITALIDYMLVTKDRTYIPAVEATFDRAPNAWTPVLGAIYGWAAVGAAVGAGLGEALCGPPCAVVGGFLGGLFGGGTAASTSVGKNHLTNFINASQAGLYDDEAWWALAWIKAYDLIGDQKYLDMATTIFWDMTDGWDNICIGGLYWRRNKQDSNSNFLYKNSIVNELFLAVATALYLRHDLHGSPPALTAQLLDWANKEWVWFQSSGLLNNEGLINDSLTTLGQWPYSGTPCLNDLSTDVWSYNQGVILGALCDLFSITGNHRLIVQAEEIANTFITNQYVRRSKGSSESGVNPNGILTEYNDDDSSAGIDCRQFKGIFIRNLAKLWVQGGQPRYRAFILKNAASAIANMNGSHFGASWSAKSDTADFVRQTAGVDLLNAALMVRRVDLSYLVPLLLSD